jgi:hypothetical protein
MTQHDYEELVEASGRRRITGAIRSGITLANGANVEVQGVVAGPVTIGDDAVLTVLGSFVGDPVVNEGMLILHGQMDIDPDSIGGYLAVGIGSVLTGGGGAYVLDEDGALHRVSGKDNSLKVQADQVCYWDKVNHCFVPLNTKGDAGD